MRGEKIEEHEPVDLGIGSSPHARGKDTFYACHTCKLRIIPACAGKSIQEEII